VYGKPERSHMIYYQVLSIIPPPQRNLSHSNRFRQTLFLFCCLPSPVEKRSSIEQSSWIRKEGSGAAGTGTADADTDVRRERKISFSSFSVVVFPSVRQFPSSFKLSAVQQFPSTLSPFQKREREVVRRSERMKSTRRDREIEAIAKRDTGGRASRPCAD